MIRLNNRPKDENGFTLVELLIATAVFGVMLLIITIGILEVGRTYYKGLTESRTQDTARSILDSIAQDIQFSGQSVIPPASYTAAPYALQIGANCYSVRPANELEEGALGPNQSHSVLMQDTIAHAGGCNIAAPPFTGREMMGLHMRLASLTLTQVSTDLWQIHIRLVYGDNSTLCTPTIPATCSGAQAMQPTDFNNTDLTCKLQIGDQFCAASELTTTVQKQIT